MMGMAWLFCRLTFSVLDELGLRLVAIVITPSGVCDLQGLIWA